MPEKFPFMIGAVGATGLIPGARVNVSRVLEAIVIAVLTAGFTTYTSTQVLDARLCALDTRVTTIENYNNSSLSTIRSDMASIRSLVEQHVTSKKD